MAISISARISVTTILLAVLLLSGVCFGRIITVDANAAGTDDGSSWANAYTHLQSALVTATDGDEIRIAQGIYKPAGFSGDRTASFWLINNVTIKGGFAGYGAQDPNDRDIEAYETILSGDLNGDDSPDLVNNSENSYHVITASEINETAVIDGLTITAGNANGTSFEECGGGMYNSFANPTMINCKFSKNYALSMGGGVFNYESCPTITNCLFVDNVSDDDGGGMRNYLNSHAIITGCDFIGNLAFEEGGGLNNRKNSNAIVTDCRFINNTAGGGGGMENHVGKAAVTGVPVVANCLFVGNISNSGGGMRNNDPNTIVTNCTFVGNTGSGMENRNNDPIITNCIFWANSGGSLDGTGTPTVTFSNVEGGFDGQGNIDIEPCFIQMGYLDDDGFWVAGDYHLSQPSPCIDSGDPNDTKWKEELWPHGKRINMGTYGGTAQASTSSSTAGNIADLNNDGAVDAEDLALIIQMWLAEDLFLAADLNRNGSVTFSDYEQFAKHWSWQE